VVTNKEPLLPERLAESGATVVVLPAPKDALSADEIAALQGWVDGGGSLFVLTGEGGDVTPGASLAPLLKPYGIAINADGVVRTSYYRYLHPKEVLVSRGCVSKPFAAAVAKLHGKGKAAGAGTAAGSSNGGASGGTPVAASMTALTGTLEASGATASSLGVEFVYPRGSTLTTMRPAVPLLSSGATSYPVQRPVAAASETRGKRPGRVAVLGSAEMASDEWLGKEANGAILDALFRWLMAPPAARTASTPSSAAGSRPLSGAGGRLGSAGALSGGDPADWGTSGTGGGAGGDVDALLGTITSSVAAAAVETAMRRGRERERAGSAASLAARTGSDGAAPPPDAPSDVMDHHYVPDTMVLAERLRSCLQESEPLPRDFMNLFDDALFGFSMRRIPEAVALYDALGVKHEPLTLIPPQFEAPLPSLRPAVFPPVVRDLPPPALDLFDLDEQFASERSRLAQLTNKW